MTHYKDEQTLVIIKPDCVQRSLVGEIIKRLERVGLKLAGLKLSVPSEDMIEKHYTLDPEWRRVTGEKRSRGIRVKVSSHPLRTR